MVSNREEHSVPWINLKAPRKPSSVSKLVALFFIFFLNKLPTTRYSPSWITLVQVLWIFSSLNCLAFAIRERILIFFFERALDFFEFLVLGAPLFFTFFNFLTLILSITQFAIGVISGELSPAWVLASPKEISSTSSWVALLMLSCDFSHFPPFCYFSNIGVVQLLVSLHPVSAKSPETDNSLEEGAEAWYTQFLIGIGTWRFKDGKKVFTNILKMIIFVPLI